MCCWLPRETELKTVEFLNMMKHVAPVMGIEVWESENVDQRMGYGNVSVQVKDARLIEVANDQTDTYTSRPSDLRLDQTFSWWS